MTEAKRLPVQMSNDFAAWVARVLWLVALTCVVSALVTFVCCTKVPSLQTVTPLRLVSTLSLVGDQGRLNDLDIDLEANRLYVAAPDDGVVEIFDLRLNARLDPLDEFDEPVGILLAKQRHKLVISDAGRDTVEFYDSVSRRHQSTLHGIPDPNGLLLGILPDRAYVGYSYGEIGILDLNHNQLIGHVTLKSRPGFFQLQHAGSRLFVNVPPHTVEVIDRFRRKVVDSWTLAGLFPPDNFAMDLDEDHHRLFIAQRLPARLVVLNSLTGEVIAKIRCVDDAGDVFFDRRLHRIYVIGGASRISIVQQHDADHYEMLAEVPTRRGARKAIFVPEQGRLYVGVPRYWWKPAEIRIYETLPGGA